MVPLPYSTRFFGKYKVRNCGNAFAPAAKFLSILRSKYPQPQTLLQENFQKSKSNKPCCSDDWCESVETPATLFSVGTYDIEFTAAFCENSGKLELYRPLDETGYNLIYFLQQNLRTFFKPCPQHLMKRYAAVGENGQPHIRGRQPWGGEKGSDS
jgi:hypothetical protein